MGVLQDRVRLAFDKYSAGDLEGFVKGLVDVADVRWGWHRGIVDAEVEQELRKLRMMRIGGTSTTRIGGMWYVKDNRAREYVNENDPSDRIRFTMTRRMGMGTETHRVGNFIFGNFWGDISCRHKNHEARIVNIGRGHWGVCDKCRTRVALGSNLTSSWRAENEDIWQANWEAIRDYAEVDM